MTEKIKLTDFLKQQGYYEEVKSMAEEETRKFKLEEKIKKYTECLKHTPGPWENDENNDYSVLTVAEGLEERVYGCIGKEIEGFICCLHDDEYFSYRNREEREANANLIAAAPEMLEALIGVISSAALSGTFYGVPTEAINKAKEALKKAVSTKRIETVEIECFSCPIEMDSFE